MSHRHKWILSARGCRENPGYWADGEWIFTREACACGCCREKRGSICRDVDKSRIIRIGQPGYSVDDVKHARAVAAGEENT